MVGIFHRNFWKIVDTLKWLVSSLNSNPRKFFILGYIKRVKYNHIKSTKEGLKEKNSKDINNKWKENSN